MHRARAVFASLALCGALGLAAIPAGAQTWDLATDLSSVSNPNGAWTYGVLAGGSFVVYNFPGDPYWQGPSWGDYWTDIARNDTGHWAFGISPGQALLESDWGTPDARWTAPATGIFDISAIVGGPDSGQGPGGGNWNAIISGLSINGVPQAGAYQAINQNAGIKTWSLANVNLAAGSIVDVYVNQHLTCGNTQTVFTITQVKQQESAVPEPGAWSLLSGLSLAGAVLFRKRRCVR